MGTVCKISKALKAHHVHHNVLEKGKRHIKLGAKISQNLLESDEKAKSVHKRILRANHWASPKDVKRIVKKYGNHTFDRMLMACENISKLSPKVHISKHKLFSICKYIETKLSHKLKKNKAYLKKEKTGLARTIEYKSKRAFIHLKTHGVSSVGKGCHKEVTLSIMYAAHKPEFVANSVGDKTLKFEGKVLKKLQGSKGILKTYAVNEHRKKSGKKVYSIITKLYNAHTLRNYEYDSLKMTSKEKLYVARDLLTGLENMHAQRLAHRDLHSANLMVHREKSSHGNKKTSAVLIDFGQVVSFDKVKKKVPRVEVPAHLLTPEELIKGKHRVDVRKVESFALGCSLYRLVFDKRPEWCEKIKQHKVRKMSTENKKSLSKKFVSDIKDILKKRKKELSGNKTSKKGLRKVILKLLDPDPKKRFAPHKAREMLDHMIKKSS